MDHRRSNFDFRVDVARSDLHQTMTSAFTRVQHGAQLHPMLVMRLAAEALGALYRDMAAAHVQDPHCPCGWQPDATCDLDMLGAALAQQAVVPIPFDLRVMQPAGEA
ncbi:MAG: hypothetical protein JWL93_2402 [Hyphomicrobiales bacterium]|nr:hypothetical protein [Hyphomicrobiales bacterium]